MTARPRTLTVLALVVGVALLALFLLPALPPGDHGQDTSPRTIPGDARLRVRDPGPRQADQTPLRPRFKPDDPIPIVDAVQAWRLGKRYFKRDPVEIPVDEGIERFAREPEPGYAFTGYHLDYARRFLEGSALKPVVQFSCAVLVRPYEDALEKALESSDPALKLQALVLLVRVRAPASVHLQWQALNELRQLAGGQRWTSLLELLGACFEPDQLDGELARQPPEDPRTLDGPLCWAIRAAGVTRHTPALPRLAELSVSGNLYASLAAERSLEDFDGPEADQALARCLVGWRYDAYVRAGYALLQRNAPLLNATLSRVEAPPGCRYYQGIFLARCDNPAAIPILCAEVPKYQVIDREMFDHIARLARPEHAAFLTALPRRVRPEQLGMAQAALDQYRKRVQATPAKE